MKNKKILLSAATIVAVLALVSGGTFALWSDFDTFNGNEVAAGHMILNSNQTIERAVGVNGLAPGREREQIRYVASNDGDSVPNGDLFFTVTDVRDLPDTCTSASEAAEDDCAVGGTGDLSSEASYRIESFDPPSPGAADPCAGPRGPNTTHYAGTLAGAEGVTVEIDELAPGEGTCVLTLLELRRTAAAAPPPGTPGTAIPAATNKSQGDEAQYDIRLDLEQV